MGDNELLLNTIKIISEYTDKEAEEIGPESLVVEDLGITSFDMVSIAASFEEELNIEIDDLSELSEVRTIADLVEILKNNGMCC